MFIDFVYLGTYSGTQTNRKAENAHCFLAWASAFKCKSPAARQTSQKPNSRCRQYLTSRAGSVRCFPTCRNGHHYSNSFCGDVVIVNLTNPDPSTSSDRFQFLGAFRDPLGTSFPQQGDRVLNQTIIFQGGRGFTFRNPKFNTRSILQGVGISPVRCATRRLCSRCTVSSTTSLSNFATVDPSSSKLQNPCRLRVSAIILHREPR